MWAQLVVFTDLIRTSWKQFSLLFSVVFLASCHPRFVGNILHVALTHETIEPATTRTVIAVYIATLFSFMVDHCCLRSFCTSDGGGERGRHCTIAIVYATKYINRANGERYTEMRLSLSLTRHGICSFYVKLIQLTLLGALYTFFCVVLPAGNRFLRN